MKSFKHYKNRTRQQAPCIYSLKCPTSSHAEIAGLVGSGMVSLAHPSWSSTSAFPTMVLPPTDEHGLDPFIYDFITPSSFSLKFFYKESLTIFNNWSDSNTVCKEDRIIARLFLSFYYFQNIEVVP